MSETIFQMPSVLSIDKLHVPIDQNDLRAQVTKNAKNKSPSDGEINDKPMPERAEVPRVVTGFGLLPVTSTNIPGKVSFGGVVMSHKDAHEWDSS